MRKVRRAAGPLLSSDEVCRCPVDDQRLEWTRWDDAVRQWAYSRSVDTLRNSRTLHAVEWSKGPEGIRCRPDEQTAERNAQVLAKGGIWTNGRFRWNMATVESWTPLKYKKTGMGCTARTLETLEVRTLFFI